MKNLKLFRHAELVSASNVLIKKTLKRVQGDELKKGEVYL